MVVFFGGDTIKIKVKKVVKGTIKSLDRKQNIGDKFKDNIVNIKERSEQQISKEENNIEYATSKINTGINYIADKGFNLYINQSQKSFSNTKNNAKKANIKIKDYIKKRKIKKKNKSLKNTKKELKKGKKEIKKAKKMAQKTARKTMKMNKRILDTTKRAIKSIKLAVQTTIKAIKLAIEGTKLLIDLLLAGGWVAVVIIVILCVIGLIFGSFFGIFFSNEDTGSDSRMSIVVTEINNDLSNNIEKIKIDNKGKYDDIKINSNMSKWEEVLSLYTVLNSEKNEVITLDKNKIDNIKSIFWIMNSISYVIKEEWNENIQKRVLYINVESKTLDEMINYYKLSVFQKEQLNELLDNQYQDLWKEVIYGSYLDVNNFLFPVGYPYKITQYYSNSHKALDIASSYGANIIAVSSGTITTVKGGCRVGDLNCNGKGGNYIILRHDNSNYYSVYMHLKEIKVKVGDEVLAGDVIGSMGNTGNVVPVPVNESSTSGTHLHFVLYLGQPFNGGVAINPLTSR